MKKIYLLIFASLLVSSCGPLSQDNFKSQEKYQSSKNTEKKNFYDDGGTNNTDSSESSNNNNNNNGQLSSSNFNGNQNQNNFTSPNKLNKQRKKQPKQNQSITKNLSNAHHQVITIDKINKLFDYMDNSAKYLIAFDLDETILLEPGHGPYVVGFHYAEGNNTKIMWDKLHNNYVKTKKAKIIGLTARCYGQSAKNALNFLKLTIDFNWLQHLDLSPFQNKHKKNNEEAVFYACHTNKGEALLEIHNLTKSSFEADVFIFADDNKSNITNVENSMKKTFPNGEKKSLIFFYTGRILPN